MTVNPRRVFPLNDIEPRQGPVVYWMSRDQRARDNWALLYARELARGPGRPLAVAFCLAEAFPRAEARAYAFMLPGLEQTAADLAKKGIPFFLLRGDPGRVLPPFLDDLGAGALVVDFDPLRIKKQWKTEVAANIGVAFREVDAHNVVPCRVASDKQEWAARTIRPRIGRLLDEFLEDFPKLSAQRREFPKAPKTVDWKKIVEETVAGNDGPALAAPLQSGPAAGQDALRHFIGEGLARYGAERNDPSLGGQSGLSPYLHFGQLSPQRAALEAVRTGGGDSAKAFIEELVVRRELSDNFCHYNGGYDSFAGFPDWARKTLDEHRDDPREVVYSATELEEARTHDDAWNAAQSEMVLTGKMHGYMRMYWAKKILEWSPSPEDALERAIVLNDRYSLDGRDPNGYTGVAWSIGGVHDRPWKERPVFGKVRYMNRRGLERKFDMGSYIEKVAALRA